MKVAEAIDTVEGLWVGNAYLMQVADGLLVVDSGTPGSAPCATRGFSPVTERRRRRMRLRSPAE